LFNLRTNWASLQEGCRSAMLDSLPCMEDAANHCPSSVTGAQLSSCLLSVDAPALSGQCLSWLQERRRDWQNSWAEQLPLFDENQKDKNDDKQQQDGDDDDDDSRQWRAMSNQDSLFTLIVVAMLAAAIGSCCTLCCSRRPAAIHTCCCHHHGGPSNGGCSAASIYTATAAAPVDPRGIAYCRPIPLEHMPSSSQCGMGYAVMTEELTPATAV